MYQLLSANNANKDYYYNYRSIANLFFVSKTTVKIDNKRLDHLTSNSLLNAFQSAYTKFYSTETTLLSLHDHLSNFISMHKSLAFVFLIYLLPMIPSTTSSYSIVFLPGLAFPLFHYNGSLHISHPAYLQ